MDGPSSLVTRRSIALALAASSVLLVGVAAGCGDDDGPAAAATATPSVASAPATDPAVRPSVSFVTPNDGWTGTQPVRVKVALEGFVLSPKTVGTAAVPGQGHLHFAMDGGAYDFPKYSGANGELAATLGVQGRYSPSVTPTITYRNLPAGHHTLVVRLANNDHTDVGPSARASFTVD